MFIHKYLFRSWKTARCDESNLKYFDTTFLDHKDVFYAHLNEMDPIHHVAFSDEQEIQNSDYVYVDPRNGLSVRKAVVSETEAEKLPSLFKFFPNKSTLTAAEHSLWLNALFERRKGEGFGNVLENCLKEKINEENKKYHEFVKKYFVSNNMYRKKEINVHLFDLFVKKWKREVDLFVKERASLMACNYILATAIPLKCDKTLLKDVTVKVSDENSSKAAARSMLPRDIIKFRMKSVPFHLEKYYNECRTDSHPLKVVENHDVFLPITSLMLLMQGSYDDCEDWLLPITITGESARKTICIEKSLPRTKIGSISRNNSIALDVVKAIFVQKSSGEEVSCKRHEGELNSYQLKTFDQFMENYNGTKRNNSCEALEVTNLIEISANDESFSLSVSCQPETVENSAFVIFSPKLEYQPEFGEEQMSQCELTREWVHLKFISNTVVRRIRMHYSTYAILSVRDLTLSMVKDELHRLYEIQEDELLSSFFQLISMLRGFPPAIYLGRHDVTKKERILIYQHHEQKPTENAITSTTHLNLQTLYSDINFNANSLDELQWTPIDLEGVTDIHLQSKVAPGLFPYHNDRFSKQIRERQRKPNNNKKNVPIDKKKNVFRTSKKRKRKQARKKQMMKKLDVTSESCDPKQLFDASGQVNIMNLFHSNDNKSQFDRETHLINKDERGRKGASSSYKKRIVLRNREIVIPEINKKE